MVWGYRRSASGTLQEVATPEPLIIGGRRRQRSRVRHHAERAKENYRALQATVLANGQYVAATTPCSRRFRQTARRLDRAQMLPIFPEAARPVRVDILDTIQQTAGK